MLIRNDTPFAAIGFGDLHRDGMEMACIAARATYVLSTDGVLRLGDRQEIAMNDVYEGDPHYTPLVRVSDLVGYKPAADVTILGRAYPPDQRASESWTVVVAVGRHEARLRVHGPRQWEPALSFLRPTWKLRSSTPVMSVPLDYRLSAGGRFVGDGEGRLDTRNPLGPGVLRRGISLFDQPLRAPQIEAPEEPITDPFAMPMPRGYGPIPPFWALRADRLGTRDEAWQRDRSPQAPKDFDYRFFQVAHPDLVVPHLIGNEIVRLTGLAPQGGDLVFALPAIALVVEHQWFDGRALKARLTLDGLHLDLRAPMEPWTVDLTWRGWIAQCPAYRGATLRLAQLDQTSALPRQGEVGLDVIGAAP